MARVQKMPWCNISALRVTARYKMFCHCAEIKVLALRLAVTMQSWREGDQTNARYNPRDTAIGYKIRRVYYLQSFNKIESSHEK